MKKAASTTKRTTSKKPKTEGLGVIGELDRYLFGEGRHYQLYNSWVTDYVDEQGSHGPYATIFKDQTAGAYQSPLSCIEEMIESGMWNIANEVGDAKIKDPYTKYTSGDKEGGLYACR